MVRVRSQRGRECAWLLPQYATDYSRQQRTRDSRAYPAPALRVGSLVLRACWGVGVVLVLKPISRPAQLGLGALCVHVGRLLIGLRRLGERHPAAGLPLALLCLVAQVLKHQDNLLQDEPADDQRDDAVRRVEQVKQQAHFEELPLRACGAVSAAPALIGEEVEPLRGHVADGVAGLQRKDDGEKAHLVGVKPVLLQLVQLLLLFGFALGGHGVHALSAACGGRGGSCSGSHASANSAMRAESTNTRSSLTAPVSACAWVRLAV